MGHAGRVLLADDEEGVRVTLGRYLRKAGFECTCVPESDSAAQALREQQLDVLVADIMMPGNENLEFIHEVPTIAGRIPVILMTAHASVKTAVESHRLNVIAYLEKPFEMQELIREVSRGVALTRAFHSIDSSTEHLASWAREAEAVRERTSEGGRASAVAVESYVQLTIRNMNRCLHDLANISHAVLAERRAEDACGLMECPRLTSVRATVDDAIRTLERSRDAFKSKEVAEVRRKLMAVLEARDLK